MMNRPDARRLEAIHRRPLSEIPNQAITRAEHIKLSQAVDRPLTQSPYVIHDPERGPIELGGDAKTPNWWIESPGQIAESAVGNTTEIIEVPVPE